MAIACLGAWNLGSPLSQPDAWQYLRLAAGEPVMLPFASRQLGPLLVRAMVHLVHHSYVRAFAVEGFVSLVVFAAVSTLLYLRAETRWWVLASIGGLSFWALQLNGLMMPDLFYSMLLCGFLLLLARGEMMAAALTMFPLMLARESTLLTLLCLLVVGWRRMRRREIAAALLAAASGMLAVQYLTRNALPNQEHIDPTLYLIAKLPWNLLKNLFGVEVWANVYRSCEVPRWSWNLHLGPLRAVGVCGFSDARPIQLLAAALALYGLLPLLLVRLGWTRIKESSRENLLLRFAVVYGLASFALAPALGVLMIRLFGYGWPLFLVALPLLLYAQRARFRSAWAAAAFVGMHLFLSWALLWITARSVVVVGIALYAIGWIVLRREFALAPRQV